MISLKNSNSFSTKVANFVTALFIHSTILSATTAVSVAHEFNAEGQLDLNYNYYNKMLVHRHTHINASGVVKLSFLSRLSTNTKSNFILNIKPYTSSSQYGKHGIVGEMSWELKGALGTIKLGASPGVAYMLQTGASTIAKASGGIAGKSRFLLPITVNDQFLVTPSLPSNQLSCVYNFDNNLTFIDLGKFANKITYIAPTIKDFVLGISYIPDTSYRLHTFTAFNKEKLKNIMQIALLFYKQFEDISIKTSLTYENARIKSPINAWELGLNAAYRGFTLGWSIGNWGKYAVNFKTDEQHKSSNYLTLGSAYTIGPFGCSITYIRSTRSIHDMLHNVLNGVVLGAEYRVVERTKLYLEVARYNMKNETTHNILNVSTLLVGAKLSF